MENDKIERVYYSLTGNLIGEARVPGVENAFSQGSVCMQRYKEMLDVYERVRERLGVVDEDADVEIMINNLLDIQQELCFKMYRYGAIFGRS